MPIPPNMEDFIRMMVCRQQCESTDLRRFRSGQLYRGVIAVGMIFEWEPDKASAAETCEVIRITDRAPDPDKWIVTRSSRVYGPPSAGGEFGNDESRFREAVVKSMLRYLP